MLVGRVWGGLGNQLFQYAYLYALKKKSNQEMKLDISFYKNQELRAYRLNLLNIKHSEIIGEGDIPKNITKLKKKWNNRIIRILPIYKVTLKGNWRYFKEMRYKYLEYANNPRGENIYIDGYWQTEKYFKEFTEEIKEQFTPKYELDGKVEEKMKEITSCCSVSVHIRRGDYLNISKFNRNLYLLDESYYKNAIEKMKEKLNNPVFFFFSDDIDWVKEKFGNKINYKYIRMRTTTNDIDELILMSKCKHNIVANSTYSWWGAWLNINKEKIVISPKKKYGNRDIIPEKWTKI